MSAIGIVRHYAHIYFMSVTEGSVVRTLKIVIVLMRLPRRYDEAYMFNITANVTLVTRVQKDQ